jgi:hypothetical protein
VRPLSRGARIDLLLIGALLAIALLRSVLWICAYPALKIADETSHFDNIQFRAEHKMRRAVRTAARIEKVMPRDASVELQRAWDSTQHYWRHRFVPHRKAVPEEKELAERARNAQDASTTGQNSSIGYPGFYYTLAAVPYRVFRRSSVLTRLYAIRALSMLWGLALVVCTFLAARAAVDNRALAFAAGLFATLQPLAAQQTVGVNNDAGVIGLCAIIFLLQLRLLRRLPAEPEGWVVGVLAVTHALAVETKPHAYAMLPGSLVLAGLLLYGAPRARRTWRLLALAGLAYAATRIGFSLLFDRPFLVGVPQGTPITDVHEIPSVSYLGFLKFVSDFDLVFFDYLFGTGWGYFCWLDFGFAEPWFEDLRLGMNLVWLGSAAAITRRVLAPHARFFWSLRAIVFSAFTTAVGFVVILYAEYSARVTLNLNHAIQGRGLLFLLPAVALLGLTAFGSLVPRRFHTLLAALGVLWMTLLAAGALSTVVWYQYGD